MSGDESGLGGVLAAAEDAGPAASVDVVTRRLRKRFEARTVSFLFADLVKRELVRLSADQAPPGLPVPASAATNQFRLLTRGAERPDSQEVTSNPRAASARLRAAERIREAA